MNLIEGMNLTFLLRFEVIEYTHRFIKIQPQDYEDKFCILQGNKKLLEKPFGRVAGCESPYIQADVTIEVRDIRNSVRIKQKEFREKRISAWIRSVVPTI